MQHIGEAGEKGSEGGSEKDGKEEGHQLNTGDRPGLKTGIYGN